MQTDGTFRGRDVQLVELTQDHPGFNDKTYRARRDEIAGYAASYTEGAPIEDVAYNADEQSVWRAVWDKLAPLHEQHACEAYLRAAEAFGFAHDHIPGFAEINARLEPTQGFTLAPVAGLVRPETFLLQLGQHRFLATQYMRHGSEPLYTPEPDVVHEYIGHVALLASPQHAALSLAFGRATERATAAEVDALIRVYWYTIEFGVLQETDTIKVYGAGHLSSFGEIQRVREAQLRPWSLPTMAETPFDPTRYQSQLFVAPSYVQMQRDVLAWLETIGR